MVRIGIMLVALLATSCSGDGSNLPSPTPTPSPTPSPSPSAVPGVLATMTEGPIPGSTLSDVVDDAEASNQGLYIHVTSRLSSGTQADKVVKLEGDPAAQSAWKTILPEPDGRMSFAVANPYSEPRGVVDFYYVESNDHVTSPIGGIQIVWGRYSTVAGVSARSREERTQGLNAPVAVAAGNPVGSDQQKSWIVFGFPSTSTYVVHQDDGIYTDGGSSFFDRFSVSATPSVTGLLNGTNHIRVIAHPTESRLYLAVNGTLYAYGPTTQIASYKLGDDILPTDTIIYYQDSLFIGYGDGIWQQASDGTMTKITTKVMREIFASRAEKSISLQVRP